MGDVRTATDVLVIGGGPGGYVAAIRAAQHGLDTILVERDAVGGTCLNYGCIPSKAFITATDLAHEANHGERMGVEADASVNMTSLVEWKDEVVDQLTGGVEQLCKANGVNLIEGMATFIDDDAVRVAHAGEGQGSESIQFEHAIVATGSRPIEVPGFEFDDDQIWSSQDALAADSIPEKLLVVGAGYIGMELSTTFAKAGSDVTVIEMLEDALPAYQDDVSRVIRERAEDLGIEFAFNERVSSWKEEGNGVAVITESEGGEETVYETDYVLVAVGREPVSDALELEEIGLETDDRGFLETDDYTRTDLEHIMAVGDVAGEPMLAHKASAEGIVAAGVAAGRPVALDQQVIPAAVFTDPEVATVGLTEQEAEHKGFDPVVGTMPLRASGRAQTMAEQKGFVRVVADTDTKFVLGGQIVAPEASELIGEVALAIEMGAKLEDLTMTVHTHPTLSEAIMEAAEHAQDQAIHTLNR